MSGPYDDREKPPYGWAALSGGAVFLLHALSLAPTTAFWDASEYITAAHVLGIPHPSGNPLFVVLAKAWTVLLEPTGLSVAVRVAPCHAPIRQLRLRVARKVTLVPAPARGLANSEPIHR